MLWYCLTGNERLGPMSFDDVRDRVRQGVLRRDDLVWHPDFGAEWKKAAEVDALFDLPAPSVPPQGDFLSVRVAVRDAWQWTGDLLWRPFMLARWFSLGFCAWLMTLGQGGFGGIPGLPAGNSGEGRILNGGAGTRSLPENPEQVVQWLREVVAPFSGWILGFIFVGLFLLLFVSVLLCWLRARGVFMFMFRLENKNGTIGDSWSDAAGNAERLFFWRILFGLFSLLVLAVPMAWGIVRALSVSGTPPFEALVRMLAGPVVLFAIAGTALSLLYVLAADFLEPVMFWQRSGLRSAWGTVARFVAGNPGAVVRFELLKFALLLLAGMAVFIFCLLSCCVGGIMLFLPYIGAVVTLPISVFFRAYGMSFLRQWQGLAILGNPRAEVEG